MKLQMPHKSKKVALVENSFTSTLENVIETIFLSLNITNIKPAFSKTSYTTVMPSL